MDEVTQATIDMAMDRAAEIGRKRRTKALAKGMNAPVSRCHGTFIYYSNLMAWCLSCYSPLKRGWPSRSGLGDGTK